MDDQTNGTESIEGKSALQADRERRDSILETSRPTQSPLPALALDGHKGPARHRHTAGQKMARIFSIHKGKKSTEDLQSRKGSDPARSNIDRERVEAAKAQGEV
jgi:hypothetical protein